MRALLRLRPSRHTLVSAAWAAAAALALAAGGYVVIQLVAGAAGRACGGGLSIG